MRGLTWRGLTRGDLLSRDLLAGTHSRGVHFQGLTCGDAPTGISLPGTYLLGHTHGTSLPGAHLRGLTIGDTRGNAVASRFTYWGYNEGQQETRPYGTLCGGPWSTQDPPPCPCRTASADEIPPVGVCRKKRLLPFSFTPWLQPGGRALSREAETV